MAGVKRLALALLACALLLPCGRNKAIASAASEVAFVPCGTYMMDYADVLFDDEREELQAMAAALQERYDAYIFTFTKPWDYDGDLFAFSNALLDAMPYIGNAYVALGIDTDAGDMPIAVFSRNVYVMDGYDAMERDMMSAVENRYFDEAFRCFLGQLEGAVEMPARQEAAPVVQLSDRELLRRRIVNGQKAAQFVFDEADLLSDEEEARIMAYAEELYEESHINFIYYTCRNSSEWSMNYSIEQLVHNTLNLQDTDGCMVLTVDMEQRLVGVDAFQLIYNSGLITDDGTLPIMEAAREYVKAEDYPGAYNAFVTATFTSLKGYLNGLRESGMPQAWEAADAMVEPGRVLYDTVGCIPKADAQAITARMERMQRELGVNVAVVAVEMGGDVAAYAEYFMARYREKNAAEDCALLFIDVGRNETHMIRAGAARCAYESPSVKELLETSRYDIELMGVTPDGLEAFLDAVEEDVGNAHMLARLEIPAAIADTSILVHDYAGALSEAQLAQLREKARAYADAHNTNFLIICYALEADWLMSRFVEGYMEAHRDSFGYDSVWLFADVRSGGAEAHLYGKPYQKIRSLHVHEATQALRADLSAQTAFANFDAFLDTMDKHMRSIIPKAKMVDEFSSFAGRSVMVGIAGAALGLLLLYLIHRKGVSMKQHASSAYLRSGSFTLHYSKDVFISTHTSRTKKASSSGSSGGGGSRSGGTSSSAGSRGSF